MKVDENADYGNIADRKSFWQNNLIAHSFLNNNILQISRVVFGNIHLRFDIWTNYGWRRDNDFIGQQIVTVQFSVPNIPDFISWSDEFLTLNCTGKLFPRLALLPIMLTRPESADDGKISAITL